MRTWKIGISVAIVVALAGCGNAGNQTEAPVRPVATSPNAAYQTTFPEVGATGVTVLEDKLPGGEAAETPTPAAAPVVTAAVNEEVTVSPETIDIPATTATAGP